MLKKQLLLFIYSLLLMGIVYAQKRTVTGVVTDTAGLMQDVTVSVRATSVVIATDFSGTYTVEVPSDTSVLVFTKVGYEPVTMPVGNQSVINVRMKSTTVGMEEVTVVGFGTQKKKSVVGSITSVNVAELKIPTSNLTNTLAGKIAGIISFQSSGEPGIGTDNSNFYIRGLSTFGSGKRDPLILIDGVESSPTDMARMQPDDIADFSVLKDAAAAAVYGARGANGVILINTKTGKSGVTKFNFRGETRLSKNSQNVAFTDNIKFMELANEATLTRNPQLPLPYTQNKINNTIAGVDPYLYPNNDWVDQLIKNNTVNYAYNLGITGGTQKARYYVAGTYNVDNGILKVDPINNFNSNIRLRNYSLRSNIDLNLTSSTALAIKLYGQFDDYNGPISGGAETFANVLRTNPVMFPAVYPREMMSYVDHPLFGSARMYNDLGATVALYTNPYAMMVRGYSVFKSSNIQPQLELKQNLNFIAKGLKFRAMTYLRRYSDYRVNRAYDPFYYQAVISPLDQSYHIQALNDGSETSVGTVGKEYLSYTEGTKNQDSRMWLEGAFEYNRVFDKSTVTGMLIGYMSSYEKGNSGSLSSSLPQRNEGVSGRFTYGYDDRYLTEFSFGYNGSERFAEMNRFGFFPSFGLAYRISNEKFFEPLKKTINELKLRATYGIVGNDQIGNINQRFFYLSEVNPNDARYGASFGKGEGVGTYPADPRGYYVSKYANSSITWEKSQQINLGMDLNMFDNNLEFIADVYKQYRYNILQARSYTESAAGFGGVIPYANYGKAETKGVDLSLRYQKNFSKYMWANMRGTFTYSTSKRTLVDELKYNNTLAYLSVLGYPVDQAWGYIAERLFVDQHEVNNSPQQQLGSATTLLAGDIKYRDINNDGVINADDRVPLGYPYTPEIIYGFGGAFGYRNFDFGIYFQGSGRSSFFINPSKIQPYNKVFYDNNNNLMSPGYENRVMSAIAESHWTEDNRNLYAFWPRLSTYQIANNNVTSTWWMRNGSFLRLKSLDAGYTFDKLGKVKLDNVRLYFSAINLFTWSKFKLWDPEMKADGLGYPIQAVYSLGVQINF